MSQATQDLLTERNSATKHNLPNYKYLRNKANKAIKREKKEMISNHLLKDPNQLWKLYSKTINGIYSKNMMLNDGGRIISNNKDIANIMNNHFKQKIIDLKKSLPVNVNDPMEKMKSDVGDRRCKFEIQNITISEAKKAIRNLKPKMSSGISGVPKRIIQMLTMF